MPCSITLPAQLVNQWHLANLLLLLYVVSPVFESKMSIDSIAKRLTKPERERGAKRKDSQGKSPAANFQDSESLVSWVWLKIKQQGQTAGFGPCFHQGKPFWYSDFLSHPK